MNIPNQSLPDFFFRDLDSIETEAFRQWARDWYANRQPLDEPNGTWHPVVLEELRRLDERNRQSQTTKE